MDNERILRTKTAMAREDLDALVCRLPENVLLLSGYWPMSGCSFLLFPRDGKPTCVVPHCEADEAAEELWDAACVSFLFGVLAAGNPYADIGKALKSACAGKRWSRIGFEGGFESVAPPWNTAEPAIPAAPTQAVLDDVFGAGRFVDATELLNELRAIKTPMEQDRLRCANEIACRGLRAFQEGVDVGVTGVELVGEVERAILVEGTGYRGARRVRAFAQVSTCAAETAMGYRAMEITTARKLASGDLALLELAVVADGFWCDRTRVRVAGSPTETQAMVHKTVVAAQEAAIAAVHAGATAGDVDEAARAIIREAGHEKEFLHVTGHGLGLRYHEPVPLICPGSELRLESGMTHTVEPGVYFPSMGGIRVEDNVLVTATGAEVFGPFEKGLAA